MLSRLLQASRSISRLKASTYICRQQRTCNVSQVSYFASVASETAKADADAVAQTVARFTRLNECFQKPAMVDSDQVMGDIRSLIHDDIKVPLSYYMDAVRMFTTRRDILRTELILHMCKKNLGEVIKEEGSGNALPLNASRLAQDPFHQVVSFAVSDLIARGSTEEAMRLWVRMASAGFVTNSHTMQHFLRRLAFTPTVHNLELFHKIHSMVYSRSWQHLPGYIESYLCVMRQHLKWACTSLEDVRKDMACVEHEWNQVAMAVVEGGGALSRITMLHALNLQCLLNAEAACRKISGAEAEQAAEEYADRALAGFRHLIATRAADDMEGGDVHVVQEITRMFEKQSNSFDAQAIEGMHAVQNPSSQEPTRESRFNKVAESLERMPPPSASAGSGAPAGRGGGGGSTRSRSDRRKTQTHVPAQTASVAVRTVVNDLVLSLCRRGLADQVVQLLQTYLQHLHLPSPSEGSTARAKFRPPGQEKVVEEKGAASKPGNSKFNSSVVSAVAAALQGRAAAGSPIAATKPSSSPGNDVGYARFLMEEAMQNIRFPTVAGTEDEKRAARYALTGDFVAKLEAVAQECHAPLRENFVGRRIMHAAQCLEPSDWKAFEKYADTIIDSSDDYVGRSPYVTSFLVNALAVEFQAPEAVQRALQRIKDILAQERGMDRKGKVLPSTWVSLLNGATQTLEDGDLAALLQEAERGILSAKATIENPSVLTARLYAHARLGHGYQSLTLLSRLRMMHGAGDETPNRRFLYTHVINALYHAWPGKEKEWQLAKSATSSIEYLLQSLSRDGVQASAGTVAALLKLYTKQAQITQAQEPEETKSVVKQANRFLTRMAKGGYAGHGKVPIGSEAVRELVKMECILGHEQGALLLLQQAEETYGIVPDATAWEPVLYYLAVVRGALNAAEDVLTLMTNANLKPTDACVDAMVRGFLQKRDAPEALERLEELNNQTGARPAASTMLTLLENAFKAEDTYLAQQVASVILRMFSEEERQQQVVGVSTTARTLGKAYAEKERQLLIDRLEAAKEAKEADAEEELIPEEEQIDVHAVAEGENSVPAAAPPLGHEEQEIEYVEESDDIEDAHTSTTSATFVTKRYTGDQYRLREGGGGGRVLRAPLSRVELERRFAAAGYEMPKY